MSMTRLRTPGPVPFSRPSVAAQWSLLCLAFTCVLASTVQAQAQDALPFSKSYLVTGNYVVGGVDLVPQSGTHGFITGTIPMSGVPANADILAAFLYWETISTQISQVDGAQFRGSPITVVKASSRPLDPATAACWSAGGGAGYTMTMFRADVLRLLPEQVDANGTPTGKRLVNDTDLLNSQLPRHTVTLPEAASGNQVPSSAGATLLVIYRDPATPLTSIVLYDGISVQAPGEITTQTIRGFLQSSTSHVAKLTHIASSGAPNPTDQLSFNGASIAADPFFASGRLSSDRGWSNPTYNVSALMPGVIAPDGYGEQVTTTVRHGATVPYDCLSWAAIIFSTTVQDTDGDGLPDRLEDVSGLKHPSGELLPDLHAMGAHSRHKDLFTEIGAMWAQPGTAYGSGAIQEVDGAGHNHLPTPPVVKMLGDAFRNAPVTNPDGLDGITLHLDVGAGYHAAGPSYSSTEADDYLVPADLARGGESIVETACVTSGTLTCQFPGYPGTVSWKIG